MKEFVDVCQQICAENGLLGVSVIRAILEYLRTSKVDHQLDELLLATQQLLDEWEERYFAMNPPQCSHQRAKLSPQQNKDLELAFKISRNVQALRDALRYLQSGDSKDLRYAWYELSFATDDRDLIVRCKQNCKF